jgi:ABC-type sugar transport system substrate-binding protein
LGQGQPDIEAEARNNKQSRLARCRRKIMAYPEFLRGALAIAALACGAIGWSTAADAAQGDKLSIGIVNLDVSSLTANSFAVALEAAAKKIGWDVISQDPKGEPAQANALCTQYVTRKVDAIIINIFEASQMAQCLTYAKAASIPVFFLGSGLAPGAAGAISTIDPDPINDAFIAHISKMQDPKVLALTYHPGAPCRVREQKFDAALAKAGLSVKPDKHEITIPGQVTTALAATQAWLNAHPKEKGENLAIWACFSDPAYGALSAMKQVGRTGVPIFTWDLTKQAADSIKAGDMSATVWVDVDGLAQQMIKQIKDIRAGGQPREEDAAWVVVTPENIASFLKEHPAALP